MKTGNILIAERMKLRKLTETTWLSPVMASSTSELLYDKSWDWLMPVIERISQHRYVNRLPEEPIIFSYAWPRTFGMRDEEGGYMFRFNRSFLHTSDTLINAAFNACVEWFTIFESNEIVFDPIHYSPYLIENQSNPPHPE